MGDSDEDSGQLRGVALVVRGDSTIVHTVGGPADADADVGSTTETRFAVASVSKQFTAAAVLLLTQRGAVALDDPLSRWFSRGPAGWRDLTVHHLLTHTSGLGHWNAVGGIDRFHALDLDQRLAAIQAAPLRAAPGQRWSYSGLGYLLLGLVIEHVDGRSYGGFLRSEIFTPLGMTATSSGSAPTGQLAAQGHHAGRRIPTLDLATMPGTGDLWSTATDLARYSAALRAGELLTPEIRQALIAPHAQLGQESYTIDGIEAHAYGYGYYIGALAGRRAAFHPGDNPGYQSFSASLGDADTSIVVLLNDDAPSLSRIVNELARRTLF